MKIAIDISPLETGHKVRGIGSYTFNLIEHLRNKSKDLGIELFNDPFSPPQADIIHYPYFDLFTRTLPQKANAPRVVTIHDVIPLVFPNKYAAGIRGYINLLFQRNALKNTDFVICDSQTSKVDIIDKLSYPREKIEVVFLAPGENFRKIENQKILQEIRNKYHLPKNFVLYVGDVNWNKNLPGLIEAVSTLRFPLVMVGFALVDYQIPQVQNINRLIRKLKLEKKVIRLGFVPEEDLVAIYNLARTTVLPSFYEGFGLPVLESMACGTPVVCSKNSSLLEIAKGYSLFCDPANSKDIAQKIKKVTSISNREKIALSNKLQKHAASFSWQKTAEKTIQIYKLLYRQKVR